MDARLFILNGRQVTNLLSDDLPIIARAIVFAVRRMAVVQVDHWNNVPVVHLVGLGFDVYIRGEDWALIAPYLEGDFNPVNVPVPHFGIQAVFDASDLDITYKTLYRRVHGILTTLFLDSNPNPPV